ncbi:alpha/beta fold hydrolase [Alphaproteobacteria bacterium GH1-50]|uniref:Alpha/beta fold hydrolase n=1 Tax=Kangsaoukella pontilimi TaxID=2691042 RepID=A0A7C9ITV2_9RHOB|nr:alpha/beta hydrolase [Kangsaoukella pontilimi]MXQ09145.1 alpha/beta fold hydrolase [Kangsaoukella pontilimi]
MPEFHTPDGTRLHYTDEGAGKPVLALSGLTRNGTDFDYVAPHLGGVRLIRLDYRGRGKSDWSGAETYTIPIEAGDAIALLDHLDLPATAILGTSRGGLIAMVLAAMAKDRLTGVCLVDIGPEIDPRGLDVIKTYIGKNPAQKTYDEAVAMRAELLAGFKGVPESRWREEVVKHYRETPDGLQINYDPALRDAVLAAGAQPTPDLWPLFDAMAGLPLATIRGANSDLLTPKTLAEMQRRRPDMIVAEVPDRGHVPFLDEAEALKALEQWLEKLP